MKMILVDRCNHCPYYDTELPDVFVEGGQFCNYPGKTKRLCAFNEITPVKPPKWCPLPNKED